MSDSEDAERLAREVLQLCRDGDERLLDHVDRGVPVDLCDADGNALVVLAVYGGGVALVRGLAERGADVNHVNHGGQVALAGAVLRKDDEMVAVLLDLGADPDLGSPTARQTAEMFRREEFLRLFG